MYELIKRDKTSKDKAWMIIFTGNKEDCTFELGEERQDLTFNEVNNNEYRVMPEVAEPTFNELDNTTTTGY
jgi:hypothetical protein